MASTRDEDVASSSTDNDNKNESPEEIFPGCSSITDFSQQMLRTVVQATKTSNDLPTGDDYDYYSTYNSVRNVLDLEAGRILQLLQNVMRHQNVKGTITGTDHALELDEQFDVIIDANDQILERVGTWVDEATGVRKNEHKLVVSAMNRPNPAVASWNKKKSGTGSPSAPVQLLTARNIQRPQLSFKDKIDNSNKPFVPIITSKPHAVQPLQDSLQLPAHISLEDTESPDFVYPHPYKEEVEQWQPLPHQLERVEPQEVKPVDLTSAEFIDTAPDLAELCDLLKNETEIAVDLEHHSYRTFQGFVCLMQVSTRTRDFLIDTLALRSDMSILNEVFTDPKITKVFHGADSDIDWLQRDFGLYVVNMFDTGQAARVLNHARYSLAHLLQVYCQVDADKQFQLSDWRMRPLHEKMIRYAQEDTHYLLHIYDRMRGELIDRGNEQKNLLHSVFQRSKNVCLKVFKKMRFTPDSHLDLYMKSKKVFNSQQLQALKSIYSWRDSVARDEDESVHYVLPNHMLLQMAEILPRERQGVLACCNPIPPLVRQCQHEVHSLIMEARETTLAPIEEKRSMEPSAAQHPHYHTSISTCRHDLSKQTSQSLDPGESSDGIRTKSNSSLFSTQSDIILKRKPILSALFPDSSVNARNKGTRLASKIRSHFCDPFSKFLPDEARAEGNSVVKPPASAKGEMSWRLKASTGIAPGTKRKSDVDLNTFAPEFAPPAKSKRAETVPESATATKPSASTETAATTTPTSSRQKVKGLKKKKKKVVEVEVEDEEEENPLSMRQLMKKKKKEKKAKKIALASDSPQPSPQTEVLEPSPDVTQEKKKKKKKKVQLITESLTIEPMEDEDDDDAEKKKKKKKKKQKVAEEGVMESVTPFDYSTADKSAFTGKGSQKQYPGVYNPHFRGGDKKQNKGKKKRVGQKHKKSMSFKPGAGGKK
ncbi:exosome complex component 10-like isoform X2 [Littorina saxatilis]|uniref:exosome complex component 10-like isoform X2 n=1 Tax=Littorina saxatilis TaxID=31220 RepID=UPI0038B5CAA1